MDAFALGHCPKIENYWGIEEALREHHTDPSEVFKASIDYLWSKREHPEVVVDALELFKDYGLSITEIRDFVDNAMSDDILDDIIRRPIAWCLAGIDFENYVKDWVKKNGWEFIHRIDLKKIPKTIPLNQFIEYSSMKDIVELLPDEKDYTAFLDEFVNLGGSLTEFSKCFLRSIGYNPKYAKYLAPLYVRDQKLEESKRVFSPTRLRELATG